MNITRNNYEEFFLDFAEGNLSPELEKELMLFLEANPDLRSILEEFELSPVPPIDTINDNLKKNLRKNILSTDRINENNIEDWLILETEGMLAESEKVELNRFLELNPAFDYDRKFYRLTKTSPDLSVTIQNKNSLYRKPPVVPIMRLAWIVSGLAALILLLIGIRFFNRPAVLDSPQETRQEVKIVAEVPQEIPAAGEQTSVKTTNIATENESGKVKSRAMPEVVARTGSFRMISAPAKGNIQSGTHLVRQEKITACELSPVEYKAPKEKKLVTKVISNLAGQLTAVFRNNANLDKIRDTDINFWSLAEAGVKGFNSISDRDLELLVRKDNDGRVKSYALVEQDRLLITKSLDKN